MKLRCLVPGWMFLLWLLWLIPLVATGAAETAVSAVWQEGEAFVEAPGSGVKCVGEKAPASGGQALWGLALSKKGRAVRYEVTLTEAVPNARLILRYARQLWKPGLTAVEVPVELAGPGGTIERSATFGGTHGWGDSPGDWALATVDAGNLAAGKWSIKFTSPTDDGDVCLDGFFVASRELHLAAEEFAGLQPLQIGASGYVGVRTCTNVLDQKAGRTLTVIVRNFAGAPGPVKGELVDEGGKAVELAAPQGTKTEGDSGARRMDWSFPAVRDGAYRLKITCSQPAVTLEAPVWLAGELLAGLDERIARLESFSKGLAAMGASGVRQQSDFDYAVAYLKLQGQGHLRHCAAAADDTEALHYLASTKMRPPEIVFDNVRNTLAQYEETMARLQKRQDPDAGRIGDFRRSLVSEAKGAPVHYRLYVPKSYATAEKVPLILTLHGANDDEDGMAEVDGCAILQLAEKRGYILVLPTYSRGGDPRYMDFLLEVLAEVRAAYPKVDPSRTFVYGFSMGGGASSQIAANHPEVFAAACAGGGLCPMDDIDKIKVPLLILIGSEDPGLKLIAPRVARMMELAEPFDMHVDPGVPHTLPAQRYMTMTMDFFEKHGRK